MNLRNLEKVDKIPKALYENQCKPTLSPPVQSKALRTVVKRKLLKINQDSQTKKPIIKSKIPVKK